MTEKAVMWLHYCLDAKKIKCAALKFADTNYRTNLQNKREAPNGGRGAGSSTKLCKEKIRLKIVLGKG